HCGAVVMAQRDDAEAVANLGADYPYLFDIRRGRDIVDCVERVSESFGSQSWNLAREKVAALKEHCRKNRVIDAFLAAVTPDAATV
ncbi:hypothetical protein, partial [Parvibaculum sp.]|uniref:hypothetical protein n=1 Tax=Parvibaculum sp. TaxID=2024848 RepID=UPI00320F4D95